MTLRRSKVNMWDHLTCPQCGDLYLYENGVRVPDPALSATFTMRVVCSPSCARDFHAEHPFTNDDEGEAS